MSNRLHLWGLALFFFSGFTGLVYEVLWTRRLGLTFGHSTLAISTVVTAYMGGLALGGYFGGRWADSRRQGGRAYLRAYAQLEVFIGCWGLLSFALLEFVERLYFHLAGRGWQGLSLQLTAFAACLMALVPPTTAMGATLPLLSCFYAEQQDSEIGVKISRLYASNTWGAVVGSALAGFLGLPWLGWKSSLAAAAAINLLVGCLGWWVAGGPAEPRSPGPASPGSAGRLPWVFALSGFASMLFQLGWTRGLSVLLGSSVYAFSAILLAFLGGIAAGSGFYSWWKRFRSPHAAQLGLLYAGVALGGLLSLPLLLQLPGLFVAFFPAFKGSFAAILGLSVSLCTLTVICPTFLMGLIFPLVTHLHHQGLGRMGQSVGLIYAANTFGCILGSFLGGFFVLPGLGVQAVIQLACALYLVCALAMSPRLWPSLPALALLAWFLPGWDKGLASAGVAVSYASRASGVSRYYPSPTYYKDGLSCSVALFVEGPGAMSLRVNGKTDASLQMEDRVTQTTAGLIGLLYTARPERVAVVGLGSGLTVTALAGSNRVKQLVCAELEPAVIECQRYWAPFNRNILRDPRVDLRVADGRTLILSSPVRYDLIFSEPSNPWIAGIGNLYTADFYRACASRIHPQGCFVQWLNLYAVAPQDIDLVIRSFYSAFPCGDLWSTGGDLVLVGGLQELHPRPDNLSDYAEWLPQELHELGFSRPEELAAQYLCSREEALQKVGPGPVNSDDLPLLEYSAPRSLYRAAGNLANLQRCFSWRSRLLPRNWPDDPSHDYYARAGALNFPHQDLVVEVLRQARPPYRPLLPPQRAGARPLPVAEIPQRLRWAMARRELKAGKPRGAMILSQDKEIRAEALMQLSQWKEAAALYREILSYKPDSLTWSSLATSLFFAQDGSAAMEAAQTALKLNPYDPRALYVVASLQRSEEGARELTRICPDMTNAWTLLARLQSENQRPEAARATIRQGLKVTPGNPGLLDLQKQLGP